MARPTNWSPLADSDPVPGDTTAIRAEASRMRTVASTIREQVTKLRSIGKDPTLCGKYVVELRSGADDLAGKLEKTAGRYEKVSGHLDGWANDLDQAQADSVVALNMAKPADEVLNRQYVSAPKKAEDMTPAERRAEQDRKDAETAANAQLDAAKAKLRSAVDFRDTREDQVATWIREAIDDAVEDSWWDNVKDFVDKYADVIKVVIDVLSYVATALAIVAMFIPGLNVIVLALTIAVVLGRTLLALTGNASWMDVLVDAIGLLPVVGKLGGKLLKGANTAAKTSATAASRAKVAQNLARSSSTRKALGKTLNSRTASAAQKRAARRQIDALKKAARRDVPKVPQDLPKSGRLAKILHQNDTGALEQLRNVNRIADRFPGAVTTGTKAKAWAGYLAESGTSGFATAADYGDKIFGSSDMIPGKAYNEDYNNFKGDTWKAEVGSTW